MDQYQSLNEPIDIQMQLSICDDDRVWKIIVFQYLFVSYSNFKTNISRYAFVSLLIYLDIHLYYSPHTLVVMMMRMVVMMIMTMMVIMVMMMMMMMMMMMTARKMYQFELQKDPIDANLFRALSEKLVSVAIFLQFFPFLKLPHILRDALSSPRRPPKYYLPIKHCRRAKLPWHHNFCLFVFLSFCLLCSSVNKGAL